VTRFLTSCGTRRAKWFVAAFWLAVFIGLNAGSIFERFADAEQNRSVDYLPENAESVQLLNQIDEFPSGERFSAVVVYRRDGGLTPRDRAVIAQDRREALVHSRAGELWRERFVSKGAIELDDPPLAIALAALYLATDVAA